MTEESGSLPLSNDEKQDSIDTVNQDGRNFTLLELAVCSTKSQEIQIGSAWDARAHRQCCRQARPSGRSRVKESYLE